MHVLPPSFSSLLAVLRIRTCTEAQHHAYGGSMLLDACAINSIMSTIYHALQGTRTSAGVARPHMGVPVYIPVPAAASRSIRPFCHAYFDADSRLQVKYIRLAIVHSM
jgi:hypothetical protein